MSHRMVCDIWPPYQMQSGQAVDGFVIEVMGAVYEMMGHEIASIRSFPWARAVATLKQGGADVLVSANYNEERTEFAWYPEEALARSLWVVWSREKDSIARLYDLRGERVGVVRGYTYTEDFWDFLKKESAVERFATDDQCFRMLEAKRIRYCVAELQNSRWLVEHYGYAGLKAHTDIVIREKALYAIFNKFTVSQGFVRRFSTALRTFKQSRKYRELCIKYFGETGQACQEPE